MDGNDAIAIYQAAREARAHVLKNGPMLLVLNTYRWMGHSKSDANVYRTKAEIEEWKKKDPIKRMRERLIAEGLFEEKALAAIEEQAAKDIAAAVRFAEESPAPRVEDVLRNVYA